MIQSRATSNRAGFTLIELMMAAALALVIMTVLAVAFRSGMDTMSQMKSVAGLAGQLRSVTNILRSDLDAQHLEEDGDLRVMVSDPKVTANAGGWAAITSNRGFFRLESPTVSRNGEGVIDSGIQSYRATENFLHFSVKRSGANAAEIFRGQAPDDVANLPSMRIGLATGGAGAVATEWAEISYFAWRDTTLDPKTEGGIPLWTLYRREKLVARDDLGLPSTIDPTAYPDLSLTSAGKVNTKFTIATPGNRPVASRITAGPMVGSDILLSNVISFQIDSLVNTDSEYTPVASWDSGQPIASAIKPQLRGISIKIRVYDPKNRIIRQMTLNQAL